MSVLFPDVVSLPTVQKALLATASSLLLSACSSITGYPEQSGNLKTELQQLDTYYAPDVLKQYDALTSEGAKRAYRNEVINGRIRAINLHYYKFLKALSTEANSSQVGVDWSVLGLSGAGTIIPAAGTKAILAAISGGLTGAKGSLDKNLLYQKTLPALITQMDALRGAELVKIKGGLQADTTTYSMAEALSDTDNYYEAGTLPAAVVGVTASAGVDAKQAKQDLSDVLAKKVPPKKLDKPLKHITNTSADAKDTLAKIDKLNLTPEEAAAVLKQYDDRIVPADENALPTLRALPGIEGTDLKKLNEALILPH